MKVNKKPKQEYFDKQRFYDSLMQYKAELSSESLSADACPPEECCFEIQQLIDRFATGYRWNRYPFDLLEDMKSYALQKCIRGLMTYDVEKGKDKTFSYFTRAVHNAFLTILGSEYAHRNKMRDLKEEKLKAMGWSDQKINDVLGEKYVNQGIGRNDAFNYPHKNG